MGSKLLQILIIRNLKLLNHRYIYIHKLEKVSLVNIKKCITGRLEKLDIFCKLDYVNDM